MKRRYILILNAWLAFGFSQSALAQRNTEERLVEPVMALHSKVELRKSMSEEEKVAYLINFVRQLQNATFIRNGKEYPPGKAADHLQSKYDKHKKKAKTAHDFVGRLATESRSKEPYLIRYADGTTVKLGELLNQELTRLESM